jgi:hypothetical protein
MDVGWYSALAVAEFDPIYLEHHGQDLHFHCMATNTHALSNRIRCYSIWTMERDLQYRRSGDRHAVDNTYAIDLLDVVGICLTYGRFPERSKMKI